jgi:hypothetical protein
LCAALVGAPATAGAAPGVDSWVRPSPPQSSFRDPLFHDSNRHALTFIERSFGGSARIWRLPDSGERIWSAAEGPNLGIEGPSDSWWAYDADGDRVFFVTVRHVFDDTCCYHSFYEVYQLHLADPPTVEHIEIGGQQPFASREWALAWDPRRQRLLVVGGEWYDQSGPNTSIFALDLAGTPVWRDLNAPGQAAARVHASAWVDAAADRLVLWGGEGYFGPVGDTVWTLPLVNPVAWQPLPGPDALPGVDRSYPPNVVFDAPGRRLLLYSEYSGDIGPDTSGTWQYDLAKGIGWTELQPAGGAVPILRRPAVAFDPEQQRLSVFGGLGFDPEFRGLLEQRSDLAEWRLETAEGWSYTNHSMHSGSLREGSGLVLDRFRHRLVALDASESGRFDLWTIGLGASQDWERSTPVSAGLPPLGRSYAASAYDSLGDRGIVFGGRCVSLDLNDLWQFQFSSPRRFSWTRLDPAGEIPPGRWGAASVFDPVRRRLVVFGGMAGHVLGDAWALSLDGPPRWTRIVDQALSPAPRFGASAVYDARRDGMIVFGGNATNDNNPYPLQDAWFLSFADGDRWLPVSITGSPPVGRWYHAALYDAPRDRMLVFWGRDRSTARFDCAALEFDGQPHWEEYAPAGATTVSRYGHRVAYDPDLDMAAIIGGRAPALYSEDLSPDWYLAFAPLAGGPPPFTGPPFALLGMSPNPTRAGVDIAFDLPAATTARARIYDARGRLVRELPAREYLPGRHVLAWDGVGDDGYKPRPGVYFARLVLGGHEVTGKIVLLP